MKQKSPTRPQEHRRQAKLARRIERKRQPSSYRYGAHPDREEGTEEGMDRMMKGIAGRLSRDDRVQELYKNHPGSIRERS